MQPGAVYALVGYINANGCFRGVYDRVVVGGKQWKILLL